MKKIISLAFLVFSLFASAQYKVQVLYVGDSETRGIGTTGTGASSTNPAVIGNFTYPLQSQRMLRNTNITSVVAGYSGQNANWYFTNQVNTDIAKMDFVNNNLVIVVLAFGTNDCSYYNDTTAIYNNIMNCVTALKNAGAKVIIVPPLNRKDTYATATHNFNRLNLFAKYKRNLSAFDGFADLSNQYNLWDSTRVLVAKYFKQADADGLNYVHYNDDGAALVAHEVNRAIENVIGTYSGSINSSAMINVPYQSKMFVTNNPGTLLLSGGKLNIPPFPFLTSGTAAPTTTPSKVGDVYVDQINKKTYFGTGIISSTDWTLTSATPYITSITNTGTSGAAGVVSGVLNIPTYISSAGVVSYAHPAGTTGTPTLVGGSMGTNVTGVTITGNDAFMRVSITVSGAVSGSVCQINYAQSWAAAPMCVISGTIAGSSSAINANGISTTVMGLAGQLPTAAGTYTYTIFSGN